MPRDCLSGHRVPVLCHGCAVALGWACGSPGGPDRPRRGPVYHPAPGVQRVAAGGPWYLFPRAERAVDPQTAPSCWGGSLAAPGRPGVLIGAPVGVYPPAPGVRRGAAGRQERTKKRPRAQCPRLDSVAVSAYNENRKRRCRIRSALTVL